MIPTVTSFIASGGRMKRETVNALYVIFVRHPRGQPGRAPMIDMNVPVVLSENAEHLGIVHLACTPTTYGRDWLIIDGQKVQGSGTYEVEMHVPDTGTAVTTGLLADTARALHRLVKAKSVHIYADNGHGTVWGHSWERPTDEDDAEKWRKRADNGLTTRSFYWSIFSVAKYTLRSYLFGHSCYSVLSGKSYGVFTAERSDANMTYAKTPAL